MKYYIQGQCGHRLQLKVEREFETRAQIKPLFTVVCSNDGSHTSCSNREIIAEPDSGQPAKGAGIGVVVGILMGPIFVLAVGGAGLLLGKAMEQSEQERAIRFNNS